MKLKINLKLVSVCIAVFVMYFAIGTINNPSLTIPKVYADNELVQPKWDKNDFIVKEEDYSSDNGKYKKIRVLSGFSKSGLKKYDDYVIKSHGKDMILYFPNEKDYGKDKVPHAIGNEFFGSLIDRDSLSHISRAYDRKIFISEINLSNLNYIHFIADGFTSGISIENNIKLFGLKTMKSLEVIGNNALSNLVYESDLIFNKQLYPNLTYIGNNAFQGNYTNVKNIDISDNEKLKYIGVNCFKDINNKLNLEKINIYNNNSLETLGINLGENGYDYLSEKRPYILKILKGKEPAFKSYNLVDFNSCKEINIKGNNELKYMGNTVYGVTGEISNDVYGYGTIQGYIFNQNSSSDKINEDIHISVDNQQLLAMGTLIKANSNIVLDMNAPKIQYIFDLADGAKKVTYNNLISKDKLENLKVMLLQVNNINDKKLDFSLTKENTDKVIINLSKSDIYDNYNNDNILEYDFTNRKNIVFNTYVTRYIPKMIFSVGSTVLLPKNMIISMDGKIYQPIDENNQPIKDKEGKDLIFNNEEVAKFIESPNDYTSNYKSSTVTIKLVDSRIAEKFNDDNIKYDGIDVSIDKNNYGYLLKPYAKYDKSSNKQILGNQNGRLYFKDKFFDRMVDPKKNMTVEKYLEEFYKNSKLGNSIGELENPIDGYRKYIRTDRNGNIFIPYSVRPIDSDLIAKTRAGFNIGDIMDGEHDITLLKRDSNLIPTPNDVYLDVDKLNKIINGNEPIELKYGNDRYDGNYSALIENKNIDVLDSSNKVDFNNSNIYLHSVVKGFLDDNYSYPFIKPIYVYITDDKSTSEAGVIRSREQELYSEFKEGENEKYKVYIKSPANENYNNSVFVNVYELNSKPENIFNYNPKDTAIYSNNMIYQDDKGRFIVLDKKIKSKYLYIEAKQENLNVDRGICTVSSIESNNDDKKDDSKENPTQPTIINNIIKEVHGGSTTIVKEIFKREPKATETISGSDRVGTAVRVSRKIYKEGADSVILANGNTFTDVLTAIPFGKVIKAPILYTFENEIPLRTEVEIDRLKAKKIYLIGGYNTISKSQEENLKSKGLEIIRISGVNRYETSQKIASEIKSVSTNINNIIIASGENFPDALSISTLATKESTPILLVSKHSVPEYTFKALKEMKKGKVVVAGGKNLIEDKLLDQIKNYSNGDIVRLSGKDRYETSVKIAKYVRPDATEGVFASGENYPDAILAGSIADNINAPVLLVRKKSVDRDVQYYLWKSQIRKNTVIGGNISVSNTTKQIIEEVEGIWND